MSTPTPSVAAVEYEAVIGLECHVQLDTASKAFTAAAAQYGAPPNTQIDPLTLGLPGSLPVLNERAVEFAVRMGLGCHCDIAETSEFSRKHYFYPDLPKGYQISQFDAPLCQNGRIEFFLNGALRSVRLLRIHMEEDAGKNVHVPGAPLLKGSLVDYNRAGVPLIEIVSQPDLRSASEAAEYMRAIRQLVRYLGISDGNMDEGSLRCDANVSVRPRGSDQLFTKVEVKNINSFRFVEKAIEYEIARQIEVVRSGGHVAAETRGFDAERGSTRSQRSKEAAQDYRYFPDPDLPPLTLDAGWIEAISATLPELPVPRRRRYQEVLGLSPYDATVLTAERELADYFDQVLLALGISRQDHVLSGEKQALAKLAANWLTSELLGLLNRDGRSIGQSPVGAPHLAELLALIAEGTISGKQGKELFARIYTGRVSESPRVLVAAMGMQQIADPALIEAACQRVLSAPEHQKQLSKVRQNPKILGFFVGKVIAEMGGRAKPELVHATLLHLLSLETPASP